MSPVGHGGVHFNATYNIVSHDRAKVYLDISTLVTLSHILVPTPGSFSNGICLYRVIQNLATPSLAKTGKAPEKLMVPIDVR